MCKCCQLCLESIYWHCFEKWWGFDDNIALYEDPSAVEKDRELKGIDNMAFWDSISVIARGSVVAIQPLPAADLPDYPDRPPRSGRPERKVTFSDELVQEAVNQALVEPKESPRPAKVLEKPEIRIEVEESSSRAVVPTDRRRSVGKPEEASGSPAKPDKRRESLTKQLLRVAENFPRKKSLQERRKSSIELTLKIFREIPIIRQNSMPKFYVDTPEVPDSEILRGPSSALASPIPSTPGFNFDLRSIVEMENENKRMQTGSSIAGVGAGSGGSAGISSVASALAVPRSRWMILRRKVKPIKRPALKSAPDAAQHI